MAFLFDIATPFIENLVSHAVEWILILVFTATLMLYGWFCVSCKLSVKWRIEGVLALLAIANLAYLYFTGYFSKFNV